MDIYTDPIRDMPPAEKLTLVERIWNDLASQDGGMIISSEVLAEAARRRNEMIAQPDLGLSHDQAWKRINERRDG